MSSIDMCEHDWPGTGCRECKLDALLRQMNCACTDGSCIFRPSDAKGMVTNGGCKCAGDYNKRYQLERLIWWLKRELTR